MERPPPLRTRAQHPAVQRQRPAPGRLDQPSLRRALVRGLAALSDRVQRLLRAVQQRRGPMLPRAVRRPALVPRRVARPDRRRKLARAPRVRRRAPAEERRRRPRVQQRRAPEDHRPNRARARKMRRRAAALPRAVMLQRLGRRTLPPVTHLRVRRTRRVVARRGQQRPRASVMPRRSPVRHQRQPRLPRAVPRRLVRRREAEVTSRRRER